MNIEVLVEQFCAYSLSIRGYSKNTVQRYKNVITLYYKQTEISTINQITDENIRFFFYSGRTQRDWSVNTFIVYHRTLLVFFRWCIKQGYLDKNPILNIEVPRLQKKITTKAH